MASSSKQTIEIDDLHLDEDLDGVLKETQNLFQTFVHTRKELKCSQLETKLSKDQLASLKLRSESNGDKGTPSDWNRLSKSLTNVIKLVSDRKDIAEYERTIDQLSKENDNLKKQLDNLKSDLVKSVDAEKQILKEQFDREAAQYSKQISELIIHKELAASEASIRYDQLQSRLERKNDENDERCNAMVAQYEKLLQTLTEQKQRLRDENSALQRREETLRDQLEHVQNHSTDFLLGRGRKVAPIGGSIIGGSQRYSEVVETVPFSGSQRDILKSIERGSQRSSQLLQADGIHADNGTVLSILSGTVTHQFGEVAEVSSSCGMPIANRSKPHSSPEHPGLGGHIAKPRKKRKLFNQSVDGERT